VKGWVRVVAFSAKTVELLFTVCPFCLQMHPHEAGCARYNNDDGDVVYSRNLTVLNRTLIPEWAIPVVSSQLPENQASEVGFRIVPFQENAALVDGGGERPVRPGESAVRVDRRR
jgi:hypothetical protein